MGIRSIHIPDTDITLVDMNSWPACSTPNCPNKVCTWGSEDRCFLCEEKVVGTEEMHHRYNMTHERPWEAQPEQRPNYMTSEFAEIKRDWPETL